MSYDRIADLYMDCDSVTHDGLLMACMSVVASHGQDIVVYENDDSPIRPARYLAEYLSAITAVECVNYHRSLPLGALVWCSSYELLIFTWIATPWLVMGSS